VKPVSEPSSTDTTNGWDASANAWIANMGERGDFSREFVLDAPMLARARARGAASALDVGCGEGRFCRMLRAEGVAAVGIDPTPALVAHASACDPDGDYRIGAAELLAFRMRGSISSSVISRCSTSTTWRRRSLRWRACCAPAARS
jgi:SAM-dependent methyltransferase